MLEIYTSQFRYSGSDRLDITVKSGDKTFAPTWDMVMSHKSKTLSDDDYIKQYKDLMNKSYKANKKRWKEVLNQDRVTLVCYCAKDCFCHRIVLANMMVKAFGCEYVGEVDSKGYLIKADEKDFCEDCKEEGCEVQMYQSEKLHRCPRCLNSSILESTAKEHRKLLEDGENI